MLHLHNNGPFMGHNSCIVLRSRAVKRPFLWGEAAVATELPSSALLPHTQAASLSLGRQNKDLIDAGSSYRPTALSWLDKPLIKRARWRRGWKGAAGEWSAFWRMEMSTDVKSNQGFYPKSESQQCFRHCGNGTVLFELNCTVFSYRGVFTSQGINALEQSFPTLGL